MSDTEQVQVLVVDDEPAILRTLATIIRMEGFCCATAKSADEAFSLLEESLYHIILTDVVMPDMDGLELISRLRDKGDMAQIIVMTAHSTFGRAMEAYRMGVSDYLIKPFGSLDEVKEVLREAARRIERWKKVFAFTLEAWRVDDS